MSAMKRYVYLAYQCEVDKWIVLRLEVTSMKASEQDFESEAAAKSAIESGDAACISYVPLVEVRDVH